MRYVTCVQGYFLIRMKLVKIAQPFHIDSVQPELLKHGCFGVVVTCTESPESVPIAWLVDCGISYWYLSNYVIGLGSFLIVFFIYIDQVAHMGNCKY